ncbi:MAG: PAS domain S-box protein, partial [bacterium]
WYEPLVSTDPRWSVIEGPHFEWDGEKKATVGHGWIVHTPIQSATGKIGVLFNDTAINGAALDDTKQEIVAVFCSLLGNIIQRKRVEQALRESEEKFRALAENTHDIMYSVNTEGIVQYISPQVERYGFSPDDIVSRRLFDFIISEERERIAGEWQKAMATGEEFPTEFRLRDREGKTHWFEDWGRVQCDQDGTIRGIVGILRDITERKRIEEAFRESESRYRLFMKDFHGIAFRSNIDLTPIFVDGAVEGITGYTHSEIISGRPTWDQIIHKEDRPSISELRYKAFSKNYFSADIEYRIVRKDGKIRWVHEFIQNVCEDAGKRAFVQGVVYDITDHKHLEEQLRQTHKMEAVGHLAGGVAHNINNLLTGIIGNLIFVEMNASDKIRRFASEALKASDRAADLVQQLLAFSRKSMVRSKRINLNQIVDESIHLVRETIDRRIEIEVRMGEDLPNVCADSAQMHSVLVNLCLNARDAIGKILDGEEAIERQGDRFVIAVRTETAVIDQEYCESHSYARPGRFVVLSVSDNGVGMDAETQTHVFEPFFTTKGLAEGTGMGLASAYGAVNQHNGWIDFSSRFGKGTVFRVYLPVTDEEIEDSGNKPPEDVRGGTESILLVDDEQVILNLGKEILEMYGYTVLPASDGRGALGIFFTERDRIDLVILDLSMPHLSGWEVLERLHTVAPDVKVIVSTGHDERRLRESLDRLGVAGYASKPYRPADLARKVREVLDTPKRGR